jgi:hypothetical protein
MVAITLSASAVAALLVLLAPDDAADAVGNATVAIVASAAAALAVAVALKQNTRHGFRPFFVLAVGLSLWAAGELLWLYLTSTGVEVPYPGLPDVFYLSGYAFVAMFLFSLYRVSPRAFENKMVVIVIAITIESFFLNFFLIQLAESIIGYVQPAADDWLLLAVSLAYPLLDGLLLVPAAVLIAGYQLGIMSRLSIVLFAIAVVLFAAGDTGFSYSALTDYAALQDERLWNALYAASYVFFSCSLSSVLLEARAGQKRVKVEAETKG